MSALTISRRPCSLDPDTLETLPEPELNAGWVEVLKTALIAGGELWRAVSEGRSLDERMIFECARTKLEVVAEDERDGGRRQVLNLGHTIGHAIEAATRLRRLPPRRGGRARAARGARALLAGPLAHEHPGAPGGAGVARDGLRRVGGGDPRRVEARQEASRRRPFRRSCSSRGPALCATGSASRRTRFETPSSG